MSRGFRSRGDRLAARGARERRRARGRGARAPPTRDRQAGAGIFAHPDRATALDGTRFAKRASGFMRVEFLGDGRARLSVIVVDRSGGGTEAFALWLE